jgi:hypothetical protein
MPGFEFWVAGAQIFHEVGSRILHGFEGKRRERSSSFLIVACCNNIYSC